MYIHINYGHSAHDNDDQEACWCCDSIPSHLAYTYFGAPLCKVCWDGWWLTTEDGVSDPPFDKITNTCQGEHIVIPAPTPPVSNPADNE